MRIPIGRSIAVLAFCFALSAPISAQTSPPALEWQRGFGGTLWDELHVVRQTPDGGYILGGTSGSNTNGNKTAPFYGGTDFWLIKLDGAGNKSWEQSYGTSSTEDLWSVELTGDGGYLLGGFPGKLLKTDSSGNVVWSKSLEGFENESRGKFSFQQTTDGGFIVGGTSKAGITSDKSSGRYGISDYWVVKLDANRNIVWDRSFGGDLYNIFVEVCQTTDGGYIVGGSSSSDISGNKTNACFGASDYWIIKLDASGNQLWQKVFGGIGNEYLGSVKATADGGCVLAGQSYSPISGNKTTGEENPDYWILKLDADGNKTWEKQVGSWGDETGQSIDILSDGSYIVGGPSAGSPSADKTAAYYANDDFWVVKLNANGEKVWDQSAGGSNVDTLYCVQETTDGGFILAGTTASGISGNKTVANFGANDWWVVKLQGRPSFTLTNAAAISGNQFRFSVAGPDGAQVIIQSSTNLTSWTPLRTNTIAGGFVHYTNALAQPGAGFFRALQQD